VYARSVVSSSYDVTVVVSRPHVRQYGLNGNRSSSVLPSGSSSSLATESAIAAASWAECSSVPMSGSLLLVRWRASTASMSPRRRTARNTSWR
jgi:hypothetical protein